ncbi:MAG: PEPxxWA-CTERM sorting domain-containing protein [Sphingomonas sp.]
MFHKNATIVAIALCGLGVATPASATTVFDAFSSFNAVQGTNNFFYGSFDGVSFTPFAQNTNCVIAGVTCLRGANVNLPSVFKSDGSLSSSGTVILPTDRLIAHPGQFDDSVYIAFVAPVAGTYSYTAQFNQQDTNTAQHSVGVTEFFLPSGGSTQLFPVGLVNRAQPNILTGFTQTVAVGDTIGYVIDKNGTFFNDSTGFNFSLSLAAAVPEPSTWAIMIVGFGFVGGAMRARTTTKVRFA